MTDPRDALLLAVAELVIAASSKADMEALLGLVNAVRREIEKEEVEHAR